MKIDRSNEYFQYIAEFNKKLNSKDIIEENGAFYKMDALHPEIRHQLIRPTYSEWLLEEILLSLRKS